MSLEHTVPFAPTEIFQETVVRFWNWMTRRQHESVEPPLTAAEHPDLPSRLRYDIGELDCLPPPPASLDRIQRDRQQSLETMWLRYGV